MRSIPLLASSLVISSAALAGPLNPEYVNKDAHWLVHIDIERFVQSKVGTCLLENQEHLDMEGIEEIKEALGIDVLKDLLGVTMYSVTDDGAMGVDVGVDNDEVHIGAEAEAVEAVVVVAVMTEAADRMVEKLKADESYAEVRKDGYVLHSFVERESDQRHNLYIQRGANAEQRIVVAGPDVDRVVEAINVVAGKAESINGAKAGLGAVKPRAGSFLFTTALEIDGLGGDNPASQILDSSRQVTFDAGETGESVYAALEVAADSEQDALNISQILQGLVALGRMAIAHHHEEESDHVLKLLNSISVHTRDDVIVAGLAIPTDECCELLKQAAEDGHWDDDEEWIEDEEPNVEDAD